MTVPPEGLQKRLVAALSPRSEIAEAYLFGSHAAGRAQPHSDVDVAVYVSEIPDEPFGYEAALAADLMAALGDDRVDVVLLNRAPPLLYDRVLRDGVRLLARDLRATTRREGAALSRYCDWVGQAAKLDRVLKARVASGELGE